MLDIIIYNYSKKNNLKSLYIYIKNYFKIIMSRSYSKGKTGIGKSLHK
jgi:hypothetical protein